MKAILMSMMLLGLLICGGASAVFSEASHPQTNKVSAVETQVRRLNVEEVDAFVHNNPKAMEQLWSDDMVITNPLNKFVTKQQVLGMVHSGFLVITSYDR